MSTSAADGAHEFVVAPAEVAERLGVPLHAGDRVRFEVIDGDRDATPPRRRLSWLGSVSTGEHTLSERARTTSAVGWAVELTDILVDAGPLIAGFDNTDVWHAPWRGGGGRTRTRPPTARQRRTGADRVPVANGLSSRAAKIT